MCRKNLGVRVPQWMITRLDELGNRTEHTEKAIAIYLENFEQKEKGARQ